MDNTIFISSILGNSQRLDGGAMFGNAPRVLWEKWLEPDELGRIPLACRSMLIEVGKEKILCEAGIGCYMDDKYADRFGVQEKRHVLLEGLKSLGVEPSEITAVIASHLHFDHVGGLLGSYEEGLHERLIFENAEYVVGELAWQRCLNPHSRDRASFILGLAQKIEASGRLTLIKSDRPLIEKWPYLSFVFTHGHTPGQMHVCVEGKARKMVFLGDLVPGLPWVHLPITMGYDRFPEQLIDEKKELYEAMRGKAWLGFFTHDPNYAAGSITCRSDGRYVVQDKFAKLDRYQL